MKHSFISLVSLTFPCTFTANKISTLGEVGCLNFTCLRSPERLLTQMSFWDCLLFFATAYLGTFVVWPRQTTEAYNHFVCLWYIVCLNMCPPAQLRHLPNKETLKQKCQVIFNPQQWEKNIKHAIIIFPIMLWLNPLHTNQFISCLSEFIDWADKPWKSS